MIAPTRGTLSMVLHAHLPYVRHPDHPDFLEEDWLFEAITETYLPLLDVFERLAEEGVPYRLSLTLSPTLCEMLSDPLLQDRYVFWLGRRVELSEKEVRRHANTPGMSDVAKMYRDFYTRAMGDYSERYRKDLISAFRRLQQDGFLDILTCAATHGFLPLISDARAVSAQIRAGVKNYERHFLSNPQGLWLPECGYSEGIDAVLTQAGVRYTLLDTHALLNGRPPIRTGVHAPVRTPSGLMIFGRDPDSSRQVWSAQEGYPGDPDYREFYRDLGFDADYDYIVPYLHSDGERRNVGLKYHRITGSVPLDDKKVYVPDRARERAVSHARHFIEGRAEQMARLCREGSGCPAPLFVAPYDAELFGHWWFEGPLFLEHVLRMGAGRGTFTLASLSEIYGHASHAEAQNPSPSTWGDGGFNEVWLNGTNDWIYRHVHKAEQRMIALAAEHAARSAPPLLERALNQAARELLLAESSDWAFVMSTRTAVAYAHRRLKEHIARFTMLYNQISSGNVREPELADMEHSNPIFPEVNFRIYL